MQIRLYNSSNNDHIALRFTEVTSRQLVLPFMLSKPVTRIRLQIVQRIGGSESILAQEDYRHSGFRLTNLVLDGSTLKVYASGSVLCIVTVTPMTVDRLELTGGAKKWLVDEMFVAPYAATEEEIKSWYEAKGPFVDQEEINYQQKQIVQLADEISFKVSRDDFDALENTVTIMGTVVTQTAEAVEQKAERSTVTELSDNLSRVTSEVGTLTTSYNSISARVESIEGDIDTLTGDVSEVKARTGNLEVRAGNIEASVSSLEEGIDEHGDRLLTVEDAVVNVLPGQIELKANVSEVYKKEEIDTKLGQKADSATVSELTTRITSAEQTIDAHAGAIAQKAERTEVYTKTETDAKLGTKVDTTTYINKVGELETSIEGITGRVSNTETNIDNLTGEVNSIKSDVSQLEIRADGIQSSVQKASVSGGLHLIAKTPTPLKNGSYYSSSNATSYGGRYSVTEDIHIGRVAVYASNSATITVRLYEDAGASPVLVETKQFDVETGKNILPLDFLLRKDVGTYRITATGGSLWRNTSNLEYPYNSGSFRVVGDAQGRTNYYYYFYEIEISGIGIEGDLPSYVTNDGYSIASQVTQLADRYSVKIQKTIGDKTYATGFVSGINEQNESEFAVLADRFRVFGTSTSNGQAVFAVDTVTKKAYLLADLIVNGLIRATALEAEQLKTYMIQAGYAVFDEAKDLDLETRKILAAGGAIEIGEEGIMMIPPGYRQRSMHLDGAQLAFWDKNNLPSVAIGDLTQARQNIINAGMTNLFPAGFVDGSNFPKYGFLMVQGNIALARSVLAHSLVEIPPMLLSESGVPFERIADGAVRGSKIAPKAITYDKLAENIHIPSINETNIVRYNSTTNIGPVSVGHSYVTVTTFSFTRITNEYHGEQLKVEIDCTLTSGYSGDIYYPLYMELLGPTGDILLSVEHTNPSSRRTYEVTVDARTFPTGSNTFTIRARADWTSSIRIHRRRIWQNDQLPLRIGNPAYAVGGSVGGCYTGCQVRCEGACEASCQSGCQGSCQTTCEKSCQGCQVSCQSTCEKTSQSGGACIRQGTPVDVWDLEAQEYITVPVEDLKPGMILPWYQPETDTVIHGELLELQDASYSNEFLRIRTHNGPSIDVTFSQPFDVLADLGQGQKWYKLQAMYLRPGMQLVRPFEEPDNRLSTIVSVETVREPGTHFWNPKTSTGGYCVNGYADMLVK